MRYPCNRCYFSMHTAYLDCSSAGFSRANFLMLYCLTEFSIKDGKIMGKKIVEGTCALCLKESILKDSHLIPKYFYKDGHNKKVFVNSTDFSAFNTSNQVSTHLLCGECEQQIQQTLRRLNIKILIPNSQTNTYLYSQKSFQASH